MMETPLQYRVSGPFQRKGPIKIQGASSPLGYLASPEGSRNNMRADYYVVSPNRRAYAYVGLRIHWKGAHAQP